MQTNQKRNKQNCNKTSMADEDEIDVLGDFSFNSCLAQNSQGIPSCSDREDTVHPQWLLDSTATNWYDKTKVKQGPTRKLSVTKRTNNVKKTEWTTEERNLLASEMMKYGRNITKISKTLKTKTEVEIQALIEAEFGIQLENSPIKEKKKKSMTQEVHIPYLQNSIDIVQTAAPTVVLPVRPFQRKISKNSLLKPNLFTNAEKKELIALKPTDILYEDDLTVGSTELVGIDLDATDVKHLNESKEKAKDNRKYGNHRRKISRNFDKSKGRNSISDKLLKSPQGRRRKNSSLSEDSAKSPKLQIVLGSGQALTVSEGEQVIKIEKKKDSDSDSDIDIGVNSDNEELSKPAKNAELPAKAEEPIAVPLTRFHPLPKRHKWFNLDGEGGYTIMHTAAGDLVAAASEPRRERVHRPPPVELIKCSFYGGDTPPPCKVYLHVSTLLLMDLHGHSSRAEVMGLVGGELHHAPHSEPPLLVTITGYRPAEAKADGTHCDMDPEEKQFANVTHLGHSTVSQAACASALGAAGLVVVGWHHSHPGFAPRPSRQDLAQQAALQTALDRDTPFLALITSGQGYCCFRVEDHGSDRPAGFQLRVKLVPDLNADNLDAFLLELRGLLADKQTEFNTNTAVCPQTNLNYLEKCISSLSHHLRTAGYEDSDVLIKQLLQGIRDVFR